MNFKNSTLTKKDYQFVKIFSNNIVFENAFNSNNHLLDILKKLKHDIKHGVENFELHSSLFFLFNDIILNIQENELHDFFNAELENILADPSFIPIFKHLVDGEKSEHENFSFQVSLVLRLVCKMDKRLIFEYYNIAITEDVKNTIINSDKTYLASTFSSVFKANRFDIVNDLRPLLEMVDFNEKFIKRSALFYYFKYIDSSNNRHNKLTEKSIEQTTFLNLLKFTKPNSLTIRGSSLHSSIEFCISAKNKVLSEALFQWIDTTYFQKRCKKLHPFVFKDFYYFHAVNYATFFNKYVGEGIGFCKIEISNISFADFEMESLLFLLDLNIHNDDDYENNVLRFLEDNQKEFLIQSNEGLKIIEETKDNLILFFKI